jgi:hypothetical protein
LLLPETQPLTSTVGGLFMTDFWCYPMFLRIAQRLKLEPSPGTLGILTDPKHPALAEFPTEFHTNWQWWHLIKNSRPLILDETPRAFRPIVQVIDNFARNHKLGLLMEAKVGKGKLLLCTIELPAIEDRPEARQLLYSLTRYAASPGFQPKQELSLDTLERLLRTN